ncbi:hypothetical protein U1701_00025 [Sphingomonas sp. PB2P19]|uniref:hypothetical protein n=1 Tax=Sphingomonas rhamnosi TaxID=3096156 RepID=UPI002FC5CB46
MIGSYLGRDLWSDRHRGIDAVSALRSLIFAVCSAVLMRCLPEVAYMICYAEAAPATLQLLLTVKRAFDIASLVPVMFWMGTFWLWYPDIVLKLRNPTSLIWSDSRWPRLGRFAGIAILSASLAATIALGRAFS